MLDNHRRNLEERVMFAYHWICSPPPPLLLEHPGHMPGTQAKRWNTMLISTSWPDWNIVDQGFDKSKNRFCRLSRIENSRFSNLDRPICFTPACLNRTLRTAVNASKESMKSRWKGAILPKASSRMTGCWSSTCGGIDICMCSIRLSSCTFRISSLFWCIRISKHWRCSIDKLSSNVAV